MKIGQTRRVFRLVMTGAGVMLIGLLSFLWLASKTGTGPAVTVVPAAVSFSVPSIQLNDLHGNPSTLEDYRGQVVLVNLWATWCIPCKQEMPALQAFYRQHSEDSFVVVAINQAESSKDVALFVSGYGLSFPIWLDPESLASREAFHAVNLPSSFVVDRMGTVRLYWVGGIDLAMLEEYVTPLILE